MYKQKIKLFVIISVLFLPISALAQRGFDEADLPMVPLHTPNFIILLWCSIILLGGSVFFVCMFVEDKRNERFLKKYGSRVFRFAHDNVRVSYSFAVIKRGDSDVAISHPYSNSEDDSSSLVKYDRFIVRYYYGKVVRIRGFKRLEDGSILWSSEVFVRYRDIRITDERMDENNNTLNN